MQVHSQIGILQLNCQIESIEKSINKLKEKQTNILNSIAWTWYKTNNSDTKSDILKQHLDFMALITKKQN